MIGRLPRAFFLDLDDTIVNSSGGSEDRWGVVCRAWGPDLGLEANAIFDAIESVRRWYWSDPERHTLGRQDVWEATRRIVGEALEWIGSGNRDAACGMTEAYRELHNAGIVLLPGALEAIEAFRSRGVRLALLTNGTAEAQREKIDRFDLARYFDCIVVEGEFGVGKPDERVYLHALDALGVNAADTWMAGDNLDWDVAAPQRLGVYGIWVDRRGAGLPEDCDVRPDRIIPGLADLL